MAKEDDLVITELEEYRAIKEFAVNNIMFNVALKGALSEIRIMRYLKEQGVNIKKSEASDTKGSPDFIIDDKYLMEHKRASKKSTGLNLKVEFQKSRKSGSCPSNRLYNKDFCHLVSVDVSEYTKVQNDYRFIVSDQLTENEKYLSKIKSMQKINNKNWYSGLSGLERALATISAQQAHLTADNHKK